MTFIKDDKFKKNNLRAMKSLKSKKQWDKNHNGNNESGFYALSEDGKSSSWLYIAEDKFGSVNLGQSYTRAPQEISFGYERDSSPVRLVKNLNFDSGLKQDKIQIGEQIWMSHNLDVSTFSNGDSILEAKSHDEWERAIEKKQPCWCYYRNNKDNNYIGKLYNYYAVIDSRGIAPEGCKIPSTKDFEKLLKFTQNEDSLLTLMQIGVWHRFFEKGNVNRSTNKSGLSILPAGLRYAKFVTYWDDEALYRYDDFGYLGERSYWWSSDGGYLCLGYLNEVYLAKDELKMEISKHQQQYFNRDGFSIRCIFN